jgi:beta-1,2-mannobiose phosphorylase / 1,2-beta-oligomannan phosphorylase
MKRMNAGRHAMGKHANNFSAQFTRLGIVLKPDRRTVDCDGILNPASARLRDGSLRLYPRMVAPGNVSRIGCFRVREQKGEKVTAKQIGFALEPEAPYEISHDPDGHGCEDPRVTYIAAIDRYVMAYVAFGPRGPEVAVAASTDGLAWQRVGLLCFKKRRTPFADKDAAFFPEPVLSPRGIPSLALYHRPTLWALWRKDRKAVAKVLRRSPNKREGIAIGYVSLDAVRKDLTKICKVTEKHALALPPATWGKVKVGGGTPPVRIREGWLAVIHGVDVLPKNNGETGLRYCAGIIIQSATRIDQVLYRSPQPLFVPKLPSEVRGKVDHVVFPTAIDPRPDLGDRVYDIYYGMGDTAIGRGRLTLSP